MIAINTLINLSTTLLLLASSPSLIAADLTPAVDTKSCFQLSQQSTCTPWFKNLPQSSSPSSFSLPLLASLLPSLGSDVTTPTAFESAISQLRYAASWSQQYACDGLNTGSIQQSGFPIRFAESYGCSTILNDAIRGSSHLGTCNTPQQAVSMLPLCKETCLAFQSSFASALGDAKICKNVDNNSAAALNRLVQQTVYKTLCDGLKSFNDVGSSGCVRFSYGDFASCGFGNTTTGLANAKTYCQSSQDQCCSYLGASTQTVASILGGGGGSGTTSTTGSSNAVLVGTIIGTLVLVLGGAAAAYFFYNKKRNNEMSDPVKGGFSSGNRTGNGKGGLVLGAGSRLSFAPASRRGNQPIQLVEMESGEVSPQLSSGNNNGFSLPGKAANITSVLPERVPTAHRKMGPNAAADVGSTVGRGLSVKKGGVSSEQQQGQQGDWGSLSRSLARTPAGAQFLNNNNGNGK
ncbi:hypothetical protein HDU76_009241 [Blyttiomyces sp. JEL0837]|nr:hypothetical protein HDU76_009241 [Blyttiomyces sp. JEL0837]